MLFKKKSGKYFDEGDASEELQKFGIYVGKTDAVFSGAALNLIMDNIASSNDVMNILERDVDRQKCEYFLVWRLYQLVVILIF